MEYVISPVRQSSAIAVCRDLQHAADMAGEGGYIALESKIGYREWQVIDGRPVEQETDHSRKAAACTYTDAQLREMFPGGKRRGRGRR